MDDGQDAGSWRELGGHLGTAVVFGGGVLVGAVNIYQYESTPLPVVLAWLPVLLVGGAGIGIAMPHLAVAAMTSTEDPEEGRRAAAAIATVLTVATAFGAAVAGLLVNMGAPSTVTSARYLLIGFAVLSAVGILTARRANQREDAAVDRTGTRQG